MPLKMVNMQFTMLRNAISSTNYAIKCLGHEKIVELLCNHDAVTNITDSFGECPFHYAATKGGTHIPF